jgi:pilin isopeptide linkage protein
MKSILIRKGISTLLALVFVLSAFMTGTLAWSAVSQSALNETHGTQTDFPVRLEKYEKTANGTVTIIPVQGAEFYLFTADGTQIGGRYMTDSEGKISVTIGKGDYYFEESNPGYSYTYDADDGGEVKKYPFTVTGEDKAVTTVTAYNRHIEGSLIIEKNVQNADENDLTQAQRDTEFEFTVAFSDDGTYQYKINGTGTENSLASGGTLKLKHGEKAIFENIPVGVQYTVVETPTSDYTIQSGNHNGNITEDGATASFTNTCTKPDAGDLTVSKEVAGTGADPDKEFTFTIAIGGVTETFTLKHGESKTFDNLPIGTPYVVAEGDYAADGYIASPDSYAGHVTGENITLPFVNNKDDESGDGGSLEISKTVTGTGADLTKKFEFTVTFTGGALPDPILYTMNGGTSQTLGADGKIMLKHGDVAKFENLPKGVHYTVTETVVEGYTAAITVAQGDISSNHTAQIAFINNKDADVRPKEVNLIICKKAEGELSADEENRVFHFTLYVDGKDPADFELKAGESKQFILSEGAVYTVTERNPFPDGYTLTNVTNGSGTVGEHQIVAEFTNTYIGDINVDIDGEKTWEFQGHTVNLPAQITVQLKNGDKVVATSTVAPDRNYKWQYHWTVPKYEADGVTEIHYTVEEVPITSWKPDYDGANVKNTYIPPVIDDEIPIEKAVTGETPAQNTQFRFILTALDGAPMPNQLTVDNVQLTITGAGTASFGKITYTTAGTYTYTITEQNTSAEGYTYDKSVYTHAVIIAEKNGAMVIKSRTLTKNGAAAKKALFTNEYNPGRTNVRVTKVWIDDGSQPQSITVRLYKDGTAYGDPVMLNAANGWTYLWNNLDKNAVWTVDEINVPDGYTKTISGDAVNGFVITNTKGGEGEKTAVSVTKVWVDNGSHPQSVTVRLYKDGTAYGAPINLNNSNGWAYTWANIEKGPVWTVDEIHVPSGYTKTVTGDAATGFTITNTKGRTPPSGKVTVSGTKTWNHGSLDAKYYPKAITVVVKANGNVTIQKQITEADHWYYAFTLDKYDAGGNEITYTVDEVKVPGYDKTVNGCNLINTYNPDSPDNPNNPDNPDKPGYPNHDTPKTGDDSNIHFWIVSMLVSLVMLVILTLMGRRGKKQRYIPLH